VIDFEKQRELDFFQSDTLREISKEKEEQQSKTLAHVIMEETQDKNIVILFDALQRSFKIIARAVRMAGTKKSENKDSGQKSAGGRSIRSLDVIANQTLARALTNSKMCCALVSSESREPFIVPESFAGDFVVSFYPINGSTNLQCNIAIGTIIGIWDRKSIGAVSKDDCLRKGRDLIASAYCIYSFSTELVVTFGDGNRRFRFDPQIGEFILCETYFVMPLEPQFIYSINEGNVSGCDIAIKSAVKRFKQAKPNPYSLRYTGSLIADFHRTIAYGGIYMYPHDVMKRDGKLRVLYECAPLAFIMEQAGGYAITSNFDDNGIQNILEIEVTSIHQRCTIIFGCKRDIDINYEEYGNVTTKAVVIKPKSSTNDSSNLNKRNTVTVTDINTTRNESESLI
jgi:fructose-1,6-bisphosphatase I